MDDNVPVRIYGEQLVQKVSNLLPRCKDKFVRAKLRNGQVLRLCGTFCSVINPDFSDQYPPAIGCSVTMTRGGEFITLDLLNRSISAVKTLEPSFNGLDPVVLLYPEEIDVPFDVNDRLPPLEEEIESLVVEHPCKYHINVWDDEYTPDLYPIVDVIEEADGITLVCSEFGCLAPDTCTENLDEQESEEAYVYPF